MMFFSDPRDDTRTRTHTRKHTESYLQRTWRPTWWRRSRRPDWAWHQRWPQSLWRRQWWTLGRRRRSRWRWRPPPPPPSPTPPQVGCSPPAHPALQAWLFCRKTAEERRRWSQDLKAVGEREQLQKILPGMRRQTRPSLFKSPGILSATAVHSKMKTVEQEKIFTEVREESKIFIFHFSVEKPSADAQSIKSWPHLKLAWVVR